MTRTQIIILLFAITIGASALYFLLVSSFRRLTLRFSAMLFVLSLVVYGSLFFLRPISVILSDTVMLFSAAGFAVIVSRGIKNTPAIISFSITASIVDILSFTVGPTHYILKTLDHHNATDLLNIMAFSVVINDRICPIVGVGDFLILGVYFVILRQIGANVRTQFLIPTMGLLTALVIGILVGGSFAIPFMAASVIAYLFFTRRLSHRVQPC